MIERRRWVKFDHDEDFDYSRVPRSERVRQSVSFRAEQMAWLRSQAKLHRRTISSIIRELINQARRIPE